MKVPAVPTHREEIAMGKKVLVVDDDPDVRLFSITVLEEHGYVPLEATNGEEGMNIVRQESPDLIILDVLMPRESGIKLYRELKTSKSLKHIPVIMLSGIAKKSFLRSQKALAEFGAAVVPEPEAYLEKPVEAEELAETIKSIIG
jgi:twitching motility two-component system response regulator PilH